MIISLKLQFLNIIVEFDADLVSKSSGWTISMKLESRLNIDIRFKLANKIIPEKSYIFISPQNLFFMKFLEKIESFLYSKNEREFR
jgi:hypothetical protein